ncbi:PAS domain S-box protein [Pseudodesulfovibrio sp.]|nr:PAS domain S-box protein [Pseudodesulfovibrio sp.]
MSRPQTTNDKLKRRGSLVWSLTGVVFAAGIAITLVLGHLFENRAMKAWEDEARYSASMLTGTILTWLEESYAPLSGVVAIFENSTDITESEFLNGYDGLESRSRTFFLDNCMAAQRDANGRWKGLYSTYFIGDFGADADLESMPALIEALNKAYEYTGQIILGRVMVDPGSQTRLAPVAIAASGTDIAVVGFLNLEAISEGLEIQYDTPGLFLSSQSLHEGDTEPNQIVPRAHADDALFTITTRTRSANVDLILTWDATAAFEGGPDLRLSRYSIWAGLAGSVLLSMFIAFLLERNRKVTLMVHEATADLQESEERTRMILESAGEGIFGVNLKGKLVFINQMGSSLLGYEAEELMGKHIHEIIHHTHADGSEYPVEECPMRNAFSQGLKSRVDDEVLWRKDGTSFEVEYSAVPVYREKTIVGAVINFQDITARRTTERERDEAFQVITSSIKYASRIQRSILPPEKWIGHFTSEHFVLWEPRDMVGGDFYWCEQWGAGGLIMLGDCTGHGVPGAFMTLVSSGALKRGLMEIPEGDTAALVLRMHQLMQTQLGQNDRATKKSGSDDGLELAACYIPPDRKSMTYTGARMQLFVEKDGEITIAKPDKKGIAYRNIPYDFEFTNTLINDVAGYRFYIASDGIMDQPGGKKRLGFGKKRFMALLTSIKDAPLSDHGSLVYTALTEYQGDEMRRDDVSLLGFKL